MCVHFSVFQFVRTTRSKSKKRTMKKFRGVEWGYVFQNQTSPNFSFTEVGISAVSSCKDSDSKVFGYKVLTLNSGFKFS